MLRRAAATARWRSPPTARAQPEQQRHLTTMCFSGVLSSTPSAYQPTQQQQQQQQQQRQQQRQLATAPQTGATIRSRARPQVRTPQFGHAHRRWLGSPAPAAASLEDDFMEPSSSSQYYLPARYRSKATQQRYELGAEIGHGCFATVYEAFDRQAGNQVAVKVMDKRVAPRDICQNELRILEEVSARSEHHRITPIMDVYEDATRLYFVLELMRGGDFFEKVSQHGKVSEQEAAVVVRKLCYALEALHRHGILHRDVKLENLLLDGADENAEGEDGDGALSGTGSFKLADLGFATKIGQDDKFKSPAGTIGYVSPEVLQSREYSPACDVWSAGIVLYILLVGHPPFPHKASAGADAAQQTPEQQLESELEAINFGREKARWERHFTRGAWQKISPAAKKLVSKMLRLNPQKRFTTQQILSDPWITTNTKLRQYEFLNYE